MKSPVVLVIQGDGKFSALLRENGCRVLNLELIKTAPAEDLTELDSRLYRISEYDGLFITSPVAAEIFVRQLRASGKSFAGPVYVLGERARQSLEKTGLNVVFRVSANTAEDLIGSFENKEFAEKRMLFIRGDKSMRTIPQLLTPAAQVEEVAVYRTMEIEPDQYLLKSIRAQLEKRQVAWICFFSPSGVEAFINVIGPAAASKAAVAGIGETTVRRARDAGMSVNYVSPKASAEVFAAGLIEHLKNID